MSALALRMVGVRKSYGRTQALDDLTMAVPRGSICGLVGPNGAGKTTTYGIVGGAVHPDAGEVDILGMGPFSARRHRGRLTLLPQDCALSPHMSVSSLLIHLARLQGMSRQQARADTARVLALVDLTDRAAQRIQQLSHGMRRRVAVAQAFLGDAELILLDEPTAGLDPAQVVRLRELFLSQRGKKTLIISSHILSELEATCDHVVMLEAGRCTRQGAMRDITARATLVRVQIQGSAPLAALQTALPAAQIRQDDDQIVIVAPAGVSVAAVNAAVLPVLLAGGVPVLQIQRGTSLEDALLTAARSPG